MKFVNKSELKFKQGYIVNKEGEAVSIDEDILNQLILVDHELFEWCKRTKLEEAAHYRNLLDKTTAKFDDKENFYRYEVFGVKTPMLDKKVQDSIELAEEIEAQEAAKAANKFVNEVIPDLIEFADADEVVVNDQACNKMQFEYLEDDMFESLADIDLDRVRIWVGRIFDMMKKPWDFSEEEIEELVNGEPEQEEGNGSRD